MERVGELADNLKSSWFPAHAAENSDRASACAEERKNALECYASAKVFLTHTHTHAHSSEMFDNIQHNTPIIQKKNGNIPKENGLIFLIFF